MNHATMNQEMYNVRTFSDILGDTKEEFKEFVDTRIALLRAEMREKVKMLKMAAPLAAVGILFLFTAYLLFTLALVGLVLAFLQGNPFRWAIAFAAVAVLWTIVGGIAAYVARRKFEPKELIPQRTIGVLKQDRMWIQSEVKNQV
jgi:uncharacterized membrane protein YqjE